MSGSSAASDRSASRSGARVAAVAAEAAGVDERDPIGVEQLRHRRGRLRKAAARLAGAIESASQPFGTRSASAMPRRARSSTTGRLTADHRVRGGEQRRSIRSSARRWSAVGNSGRSGSNVQASRRSAIQAAPARCTRAADEVRRLRWRGRDHAVEAALAVEAARRRARRTVPRRAPAARGRSRLLRGWGRPSRCRSRRASRRGRGPASAPAPVAGRWRGRCRR